MAISRLSLEELGYFDEKKEKAETEEVPHEVINEDNLKSRGKKIKNKNKLFIHAWPPEILMRFYQSNLINLKPNK